MFTFEIFVILINCAHSFGAMMAPKVTRGRPLKTTIIQGLPNVPPATPMPPLGHWVSANAGIGGRYYLFQDTGQTCQRKFGQPVLNSNHL